MINTDSTHVYDNVLKHRLSLKSLRVLRNCPVDAFFTASSHKLHGSTLKSLYQKGYLNGETSKDGLEFEYYVNNHGHRMRRLFIERDRATEIPHVL